MNRKIIGIGLCLGFTILTAQKLNADTYLETRVTMIASFQTKTWIKDKMQRSDANISFLGTAPQSRITIIRADRGVTWTLNPENKTYMEAPMALPYDPNTSQALQALTQPPCDHETENMKQTKPLLGVQAEGTMEWCKESPYQKRIYWFAPRTNDFVIAQNDVKEFSEAQMAAQYRNYPEAEREKFKKDRTGMGPTFGLFTQGSTNFNYSDRFVLANETDLNGNLTSLFEITHVSVKNLDASLFEIPAGYTKTDMGQALQDMMQQMKRPQPITK